MSFISQYREQLKQHTTSTLLLTALILFTLLLVILRLSLSAIIILSTERWLTSQQLDANIERIEISLFNGRVSLHNAEARNAQQQGFKIGELTLDWDWLPLFSKQVAINEVTLRDFSINAELYYDGGMNIGGITLPLNQAANTAPMQNEGTAGDQAGNWQAGIQAIELSNIEVCVAQLNQDSEPLLDYCSRLAQLEWQGPLAYRAEITNAQDSPSALPIYTDGRFELQKLEVHNKLLGLDLLTIDAIKLPHVKLESLDHIKLESVDISQLSLLQQAADSTPAQTDVDTQINHLLAFDMLQIGPIEITQNQKIARDNIALSDITLSNITIGDITLSGLRSRAQITPDNQLDIAAWIPELPTKHDESLADSNTTVGNKNQADTQQAFNDNRDVQTLHLQINNIRLDDSKLCTDHAGNAQLKPLVYCLTLDNAHWQGQLGLGEQNSKNPDPLASTLPFYANGNFELHQLKIKNHSLDLNLLSINDVQLDSIKLETTDQINIAALTIQQLSSFERRQENHIDTTESQPSYIFSFEQFSMLPIRLANDEIALGKISLTGSQAYIVIDKQGDAELAQWHVKPATTDDAQATKSNKNPQAARSQAEMKKDPGEPSTPVTENGSLHFSLDELIVHSEQKSTFIDQSTEQQMRLAIELIDFQLKNIDSASTSQQSSASLLIRLEDQATLKLDAQGTPLAEKPDINGSGSISALDLRGFSPIVRKQLGQSIRSGQLDAEIDIDVKQGHADSLLDLKLRHFVLRTLNEEEAEKLDKSLGFPLNTSLNLLRDKDNQIHLSIPITQDVNNLDVDIKPVIYKALSKSVSSAIVNYYTPFGLVFVAESLFDLATALKFPPVVFNPGETTLTEASKAELEKLATVMSERPGIHLTLCGFSNFKDITRENAKAENQPASEKTTVEISAEQRQQLLQLAGSRSSVVKQYLINTHQVSASRLVECEAEYAADAIAGVEIKL